MYKRGQIVRSLAGHDKDDFQIVLQVEGKFLILCDGKRRSLEKPKRKKAMHTEKTNCIVNEESLKTNRQIKQALRNFLNA